MTWDTNTAATTSSSSIEWAVWSPCNGFIAVTYRDTMFRDTIMMDVLDSVTLQRLQTLESPQDVSSRDRTFVFSPDSRILTCSGSDDRGTELWLSVVNWDLQTGGVIGVIRQQGIGRPADRMPHYVFSGRKDGWSLLLSFWSQ